MPTTGYVACATKRVLALMNTPATVTGPLNLGNPSEFTMIELAQLVLELSGSRSKLAHTPLPQDDRKQRQTDIARASEVLGWEPTVALREGLTGAIAYFDQLPLKRAGAQL